MSQTTAGFPHLNEPAPDFKALTRHGERSLSDDQGKWLMLFLHSADFTPVCTTEFIGFAKAADTFKKMSCELPGLSIDSIDPHGLLRAIVHYPMSNGRSIDEFVRLRSAMQTSDAMQLAMPKGWKPGGEVIVPPPRTPDAIARRKAEGLNTVDWYDTTKKL